MTSLSTGGTIGVLGGGQLGRMLCGAAAKLGFDTSIFSPEADAPAMRVASHSMVGAYEDFDALLGWAETCEAITYEFENVPTASIAALVDAGHIVRPGAKSLEVAQDRLIEKSFLQECGIGTADFAAISQLGDIAAPLKRMGGQGLLKTRRDGYDGKGQVRVSASDSFEAAFLSLGEQPCILESLVPFACEISVLVARTLDGSTQTFDIPRNEHRDGILALSTVPSKLPFEVEFAAVEAAHKLAAALDHVGVLALECFVLEDGTVLANEFAPRVHNSGHWTVEACQISQFEQHILAVAGWPLHTSYRLSDAQMGNLIGSDVLDLENIVPRDASLTLYGKREVRSGRKMGHWVRVGASL